MIRHFVRMHKQNRTEFNREYSGAIWHSFVMVVHGEVCSPRKGNADLHPVPLPNAASERSFSVVRNIETYFRSDHDQDTTCSLVLVTMNNGVCHSVFVHATRVLIAARKATDDYIQKLR